MSTFARILVILAIAVASAACADAEDPPDGPPLVVIWEVVDAHPTPAAMPAGPASSEVLILGDEETGDTGEPAVCACGDWECELAMVEEAFGCGVCATFICNDHLAGGCVACDAPDTIAAPGDSIERAW